MSEAIRYDRRRFIGTAVLATAGAGLVGPRLRDSGSRDESSLAATTSRTNASQGQRKQIDAGDIKVRYAEAGPSDGPAAILLRDIDSYVDLAPLAALGYRVIVPHARGSDVMALMDALKIEKALVGGFAGSARTADVMAALWPRRIKGIVPVSGVSVVTLAANQRPLPPKEELEWWYQYYFLRDGRAVI